MKPADLDALKAAGLYDPAAPNAKERLELIEWLASQGASVEQMLATTESGTLTGLVGDLMRQAGGEALTLDKLATIAGMPAERVEQIRRAAGLPPYDPVGPGRFSPDDAPVFASFDQAAKVFGETATLNFVRVLGSSVARIAEAAVSLFLVNIEGPIVEAGGGEVAIAQANVDVMRALEQIPQVMGWLLREQLEISIRRMRSARHERSVDLVRLAVGFVDLVGFTTVSRRLSARELAEVVEQFEALAYDLVAARDGRLVKLIGDEVMFVTLEPAAACDVALTLVERFADNPTITPRGGVAFGPLLMRSGDYYGPIVNLASRIAQLAIPHEILVTQELADAARAEPLRFEPAGKRMLKGFDEPVALCAAGRARSRVAS